MTTTPLIIHGKLDPFFETGTEGVIWSVYDESKKGYDGLFCLEDGDKLTVYGHDGVTVIWEGVVALEYKRNWHAYPLNPQYGQQAVYGYWVHGFQATLAPEVWAMMFFAGLPAKLERAPKAAD
jgi:hypothetical protein